MDADLIVEKFEMCGSVHYGHFLQYCNNKTQHGLRRSSSRINESASNRNSLSEWDSLKRNSTPMKRKESAAETPSLNIETNEHDQITSEQSSDKTNKKESSTIEEKVDLPVAESKTEVVVIDKENADKKSNNPARSSIMTWFQKKSAPSQIVNTTKIPEDSLVANEIDSKLTIETGDDVPSPTVTTSPVLKLESSLRDVNKHGALAAAQNT